MAAHWEGNAGYRPPDEHRRLARQWIDAGADVIFGHSSHVFRGAEIYNGAAVLYGAGDFVDDYDVDLEEPNDEAMMFQLEYSDAVRLERIRMFPCQIANCRVRRAHGPQAERIAWRMMDLCTEMAISTLREAPL